MFLLWLVSGYRKILAEVVKVSFVKGSTAARPRRWEIQRYDEKQGR